MKKLILFASSALALIGCGGSYPDNGWTWDCVRNHSLTGREFSRCKQKVEELEAAQAEALKKAERETLEIPAGVSTDPEGPNIESVRQSQSKKTRGALESPDAEK